VASSAGAAKRASSCNLCSVSDGGNDTQVRRRVDVEGKTGEKERSCETTFAKLFDEEKAVDLIGAEDDVV